MTSWPATPTPREVALRVEAEGRPAPKGSRIYGRQRNGKSYTFPASKHEKPWVDRVRAATELVMRHHDPVRPPYVISLELRIAKARKPVKPWPSQHDVDKLARAVVDGLVFGKAIDDDRNVIALYATKRFVIDGEEPGVVAYVSSAPYDS